MDIVYWTISFYANENISCTTMTMHDELFPPLPPPPPPPPPPPTDLAKVMSTTSIQYSRVRSTIRALVHALDRLSPSDDIVRIKGIVEIFYFYMTTEQTWVSTPSYRGFHRTSRERSTSSWRRACPSPFLGRRDPDSQTVPASGPWNTCWCRAAADKPLDNRGKISRNDSGFNRINPDW